MRWDEVRLHGLDDCCAIVSPVLQSTIEDLDHLSAPVPYSNNPCQDIYVMSTLL